MANSRRRLSAAQVVRLLGSAPAFVGALDRDSTLLWLNRSAYGYRKANLVGSSSLPTVAEEDRPAWLHSLRLAIDLGQTSAGSCRILTPDGNPARIHYRIGPYRMQRTPVALAVAWDEVTGGAYPLAQFLLSPRELAVVRHLFFAGPCRGKIIGRALNELCKSGQASSVLRMTLSHLEERKILGNSPSGYHLTLDFLPHVPVLLSLLTPPG